MDTTPPPPVGAPVPAPKKGMPPLAWVGIGCGVIVIVAIIAIVIGGFWFFNSAKSFVEDMEKNPERAAAEMIVRMNPDLEMVSADDETGEITVRNTATGDVTTRSFEDIRDGKLSITDSDGNTSSLGGDLSDLPTWVPLHEPNEEARVLYHQKNAEGVAGSLAFVTSSSAEEILATYKRPHPDGFTSSSERRINEFHTYTFENKTKGHTLHLQIAPEADKQRVTVVYQEKR